MILCTKRKNMTRWNNFNRYIYLDNRFLVLINILVNAWINQQILTEYLRNDIIIWIYMKIYESSMFFGIIVLFYSHDIILKIKLFIVFSSYTDLISCVSLKLIKSLLGTSTIWHTLITYIMFFNRDSSQLRCTSIIDPIILFPILNSFI